MQAFALLDASYTLLRNKIKLHFSIWHCPMWCAECDGDDIKARTQFRYASNTCSLGRGPPAARGLKLQMKKKQTRLLHAGDAAPY